MSKKRHTLRHSRRGRPPQADTHPARVPPGQTMVRQDGSVPAAARRSSMLPPSVVPHDPALIERLRELWLSARWTDVGFADNGSISAHPDRPRIAAMQAAALQQLGDRARARAVARQALDWGCSREELTAALLAGVHHTLARASMLAKRDTKVTGHLERAVAGVRLSSEVRRHAQARRDALEVELRGAVSANATLRLRGAQPAAVKTPAWITGLAELCLRAGDLHESVDAAMASQLTLDDDRVRFLMLLSEHMLGRGDRLTAVHFLNAARAFAGNAEATLRTELLRRLVALGAAENAVDLALESALEEVDAQAGRAPLGGTLREAYQRVRQAAQAKHEHGHELLLTYLARELHRLKALATGRQLTLIEVGTTREDVPGQGSTRKLAEYCQKHQLRFITVDMDPHNSRMARQTFQALGAASFEAITAKGEDYLRERAGPIDLVFLDAYDFDHGKHSELRQSRYEKYLGARIDELACHRMHLDCAESVAAKMWTHGVVCIDDTWLDQGRWTAKGTLAMPYLQENGFSVVEARNKAALLVRQATPAQDRDA